MEQKVGPIAKSHPIPQPIAPERAKFSLFQSIFANRIVILLVVILAILALSARSFFAYVIAQVNPAAATTATTTATSDSSPSLALPAQDQLLRLYRGTNQRPLSGHAMATSSKFLRSLFDTTSTRV